MKKTLTLATLLSGMWTSGCDIHIHNHPPADHQQKNQQLQTAPQEPKQQPTPQTQYQPSYQVTNSTPQPIVQPTPPIIQQQDTQPQFIIKSSYTAPPPMGVQRHPSVIIHHPPSRHVYPVHQPVIRYHADVTGNNRLDFIAINQRGLWIHSRDPCGQYVLIDHIQNYNLHRDAIQISARFNTSTRRTDLEVTVRGGTRHRYINDGQGRFRHQPYCR